jgi:hypothetical protein
LTTQSDPANLRLLLLILTTIRRLALPLCVFLVWTPAAYAWSWPVQGPVVQPFSYDESHPYAAGQHRGVDIGAQAVGETVFAPEAGTISFAGYVPTNGRTVTIETADGYSVTLTHLGSIAVAKGATVAEQQAVGTVGPSGTPEVDRPYVHLGIRVSADPNGYVDPLSLLPAVPESGSSQSSSTGAQASSSSAASAPSVKRPASSPPPRPQVARRPEVSSQAHRRTQVPETDAQPHRSSQRSTRRDARTPLESRTRLHLSERTSSIRRSLGQVAGPGAARVPLPKAHLTSARHEPSNPLAGLLCNWAAALFALGAVLVARRRRSSARPTETARILRLAPPDVECRQVSRAA